MAPNPTVIFVQVTPTNTGAWPTTHWSLVGRAGGDVAAERYQALTSLVSIYMPVLRSHLLHRRGVRPEHVDDLVQDFLLSKILEKQILRLANRGRGNFRTFLATALDRFVLNWHRHRAAAKRGGGQPTAFDDELSLLADNSSPAHLFDYLWSRQVIGQAIRRMRRECAKSRRPDVWEVFRGRILLPSLHNRDAVSYADLVNKFGFESVARASNVLVTANRMFVRALRYILSTYQKDDDEIDNEIRDLWRAISKPRAGGR